MIAQPGDEAITELAVLINAQCITTCLVILDISRDTIQCHAHYVQEQSGRGSVAPLSRTRQRKPGFAERSRERRASETAEHDLYNSAAKVSDFILILRILRAQNFGSDGSLESTDF